MSPTDWRFWSALFAAMIFLSYSAAADPCDSPQDPAAAIIDCTQSINSGKWKGADLAAYYSHRAAAYRERGDNDRAIADYSEAIRLDPARAATAFLLRAIAFSDKGDNDHAIADYNEAIRLDPKDATAFSRSRSRLSATRVTTTTPSPTSVRRSGSIPKMPAPSKVVVSPYTTRATTTTPSPTTVRRSGSIPKDASRLRRSRWRLQQHG